MRVCRIRILPVLLVRSPSFALLKLLLLLMGDE